MYMRKTRNNFAVLLFIILALTACSRDANKSIVEINGKEIEVEIADTPESRYNGLSNRDGLRADYGMLFVFEDKRERTFVMREMNFPLDIIWIDGNTIIGISENLPPEGKRYKNLYKSPAPVDYVLEVNASFADKNNIKIGDTVNFSL